MKRTILSLMFLVASLVSFAHDFEVDGIYYNILSKDDLTCEVTKNPNEYTGSVIIPSQVSFAGKVLNVTSIGNYAFGFCSGLTSVTIPNSVTSIGESAFSCCRGLTSITIPNGVTSIEDYAFYGCYGLTSITIGNSVTSIGYEAFYNCSSLTSITIPNGVTSIGEATFYGCSGLTSVTIPNSVTSIGNSAFSGCSYLPVEEGIRYADCVAVEAIDKDQTTYSIKVGTRFLHTAVFSGCKGLTGITIPNSVTSIGNNAFRNCSGLTSITIPNSVTSIGNNAFSGCSGLTSITIPNSVTSIGDWAFFRCFGLTSVTIPNSVTRIGESAFEDCSGLTSITIGNSVTSIGDYAFSNCTGLTSITIPNSVTSIGERAFSGCTGLKEIVSLPTTPPSCNTNAFNNVPKIDCVVKVPEESIAVYKVALGWKEFRNIVALDMPKCIMPVIALQGSKLVVTSETSDAKCLTTITSMDFLSSYDKEIDLTGIYNISAYAERTGWENSETATAVLVWTNPSIGEDLETQVLSMDTRKALLLRSDGDHIVVCGTEADELLELHSINGMALDKAKADGNETRLGNALQKGQTYIIKVGDRNVKYRF